jgi:hypothetical protein
MNTYMQLLNTPGSYLSGQAEQQQQRERHFRDHQNAAQVLRAPARGRSSTSCPASTSG